MRCYAECGGMMYLSSAIEGRPMVGFFPFECRMTSRLQHFGYVHVHDLEGRIDFPAHEFHHSEEIDGDSPAPVFEIRRASNREKMWFGGHRRMRTIAGYPHVHFWNRPNLIKYLWGLDGDGQCEG